MPIWVEIYLPLKFMDFVVIMFHKWANPAGHNIYNRMRYLFLLDDLAAFMECCQIIINCLCRAEFLRNLYPKAMSVVVCKFVIVYDLYAWRFIRIHTSIAVGLARNMIFYFGIILMVFCQLIDKSLITAVCTKRFCTHQKYMLYFAALHRKSPFKT